MIREDGNLTRTKDNANLKDVLELILDTVPDSDKINYYNFSLIQNNGDRISYFFSRSLNGGYISLESVEVIPLA